MKTIKYIISLCIIFIGILIIGESHIFRLNNFYTDFDNTTLYLQKDTNDVEMANDILNSAKSNDVEVFTFIKSPRSIFLNEYVIYGTSNVKSYINKNLDISERKYTSLFLGDVDFKFKDLKSITSFKDVHNFYIIGKPNSVHQFKMDLIDKYAGNHPQKGFISNELRNTAICIWLLIIGVTLLLTYYDTILQKKENLIRVTMGESIHKIIWKNILLDSLFYLSTFGVILYILSKYTHVFYQFKISLILFFLLIILNALIYFNLYFYNLKEAFSNTSSSKKLLSLNYGLKLITIIITVFIISSNISLILQAYDLYKQKPFFESYSNYNYTRLEYRLIENKDGTITDSQQDGIVQEKFYRQFFKKFNATLLTNISDLLDTNGVLANKNAFKYLSHQIKELKSSNLDKDIYFLIPKKLSNNIEIISQLKNAINFYEGEGFAYNYDVIYYEDNINIINIDENYTYGSQLVENPVIIYNNVNRDKLKSPISKDTQNVNYVHDIMYDISNKEFNNFIKQNNLQGQIVSKTNVMDSYNKNWNNAKRVLYINLVFTILVLILEFIVITSIIKLEYEVNSIELSIKKVLGYSMIEKNKKIILITFITTIISIISTLIAASILQLDKTFYLAIGGTVILVLELLVIAFYIYKIERSKIQKILKGGNL
ncbi:DUF1430 domain-containing protein [Listeria monocytogenes]|uniref:DUF1430 domain-containing protein n=2 Tax=Bacteria TaxID=2 RepID=UPI001EBC24B9|nr:MULTISPECIES: DUF1430 domain-containing protein [Priestia]EGI2114996.1 DUF1430 domain-containing protein [Listeria monocytogenes]MCU7712976.1 DUF1430 domain-containing protein [Priestia megaterium]MCW1049037.1 DUF1430 domain-containing protein [Priestia sp. JV24]MDN4634038.1 DUF1430 domain-containing protein [Sphingomonas sp. PsM26]